MEQSAKDILNQELPNLSREITDPEIIANCISVFGGVDKERVKSETREHSSTHGVHELISRLKKRGGSAFGQFLRALEENDELKETYKRLRDKAIERGLMSESEHVSIQVDSGSGCDIASRGPVTTPTSTSTSPPSYSTEANYASNSEFLASPTADSGYESSMNAASHSAKRITNNNHAEKKCKPQGPDTRLKDIQSQLKSKIVSSLNVRDPALNRDWRGLAGEANFTVEQEQELQSSENPMEALFRWMVQKEFTISDLINMLKKLERRDLISMIEQYGYGEVSDQTDELPQEDVYSRSQVSDSDSTKSTTHKKDKHNLSQEASSDANDEDEGLITTPLSEIPEDDVFLEQIKGKALFLGADEYQNMLKLCNLHRQIYRLEYPFYRNWIVKTNVMSRNGKGCFIKGIVESFLSNLEKNDVCFVYLAGHTLQINGENYLIPTDICTDFTAADIMEYSLNINQLVKEINQHNPLMLMLFVDGAHYNDVDCSVGNVLPGLAPMLPSPNTIIVHPCKPGHVRLKEETPLFARSMKSILDNEEGEDDSARNLTPATLLRELNERYPSSFVFSLSPRSLLPLYINTQEGPAIQSPCSDTPRYSLVFVDDVTSIESNRYLLDDVDHWQATTRQLGWTAEKIVTSACPTDQDIQCTLKDRIRRLGEGNEMKVVMVLFIGFQAKDNHSLDIGRKSSINLQWVINLMCEFICGPKVLIVDEPSSSCLDIVTPLPPDVLMCVPNGKEYVDRSPERRDSFTLSLAQNLSAKPSGSLKNIIKTTAGNWKHQNVSSNLFYA